MSLHTTWGSDIHPTLEIVYPLALFLLVNGFTTYLLLRDKTPVFLFPHFPLLLLIPFLILSSIFYPVY